MKNKGRNARDAYLQSIWANTSFADPHAINSSNGVPSPGLKQQSSESRKSKALPAKPTPTSSSASKKSNDNQSIALVVKGSFPGTYMSDGNHVISLTS